MDKTMNALSLILTFCVIAAFSQANPLAPQPQANESFKPNRSMQLNQGISCTYTVTITTSCGSPPDTTDQISLSFGDAFGTEVYVPKLEDPLSGRFEQCSTDIIEVYGGPCAFEICYLQLYRIGSDGWMPDTVTVDGYTSAPVTFHFNALIPYGVWFGFDYC